MDAKTIGEKWQAYAGTLQEEILALKARIKAYELKEGEWTALRARLEKDLEVCREVSAHDLERAKAIIEDLKASLAEANQRIVELQHPPLPPVVVDPPVVEPPKPPAEPADRHPIKAGSPAGPIGLHRGSASYDYAAAGVPLKLGAQLQVPPAYEIPTRSMCHWIVGDDGARSISQSGARYIPRAPGADILGAVYRAHVEAGMPLPCRIGIDTANAGRLVAGGLWNPNAPGEIAGNVQIEIVGLRDDAEVSLQITGKHGYVERLLAANLYLRGAVDSFGIRAMDTTGDLIFDGCTQLEHPTVRAKWEGTARSADYSSLSHIGFFRSLVWANGDQRRRKEQATPSRAHEHLRYFKAARGGGLFLFHNYDLGGNRTATQVRPDGPDYDHDASHAGFLGDIVFMRNQSDGWGWDHWCEDGGQLYSAWQCHAGNVAFLGNKATDLRYGAICAMAQQDFRNVYGAKGRPIAKVHLWANDMEGLRSQRPLVDVSGVDELHMWGGNRFPGVVPMVVDSRWAMANAGIPTGEVTYHAADIGFRTYDPVQRRLVEGSAAAIAERAAEWAESAQAAQNIAAGANR